MKITIVQTEIEAAIRAYVHSQLTVNEGMEITMEFTSTRGEDGLIAAIDISPAKAPVKGTKGTVTRAPVTTAPAKTADAAQATTQVEAVGATLGEDVVAPSETAAAAPSVFSSSAGVDASDEQDNDRPEAEAPLRPSIFGGLKRPTNGAAEEATA